MKCLVTGGSGFIGKAVVTTLSRQGHDVEVYDRKVHNVSAIFSNTVCHHGDIRDQKLLERVLAGVDVVFHLSGLLGTSELFDDPTTAIDVNIKGALNVLLAAKANNIRKVFLPTKPNDWNNIYSVTSQAVEKIGHSYRQYMDMDVRVLRILNVYGPGQSLYPIRKAVPLFILQAIHGLPVEIYGNGDQVVEPLYITDVANSIVDYTLSDTIITATHELRSADTITIRALAERIIFLSESDSKLTFQPSRRGEGDSRNLAHAPDITETINTSANTSLDAGLKKTIDWYRKLKPSDIAEARRYYESQKKQKG